LLVEHLQAEHARRHDGGERDHIRQRARTTRGLLQFRIVESSRFGSKRVDLIDGRRGPTRAGRQSA
jgi:hypothetical protein